MTGYEHITAEVSTQHKVAPAHIEIIEQSEFLDRYQDLLAIDGTYKKERPYLELSIGRLLVMTVRDFDVQPIIPPQPYGMERAKGWLQEQLAHDEKLDTYATADIITKAYFRSWHRFKINCQYGKKVPFRKCRNVPDMIDRQLGDENQLVSVNLASLVRLGVVPQNASGQEAA